VRLPPWIVKNTEEVLREIMRFTAPADGTLSHYFRTHPKLGSRERGMISEAVYATLRNKVFYSDFAGEGGGATMRRLALLGLCDAVGIEALSGLPKEETTWLERIAQIDRTLLSPVMRSNLPQWLFDKLLTQYGEEQTMQMTAALNQPAPLDLRVNSIKATHDEVVAALNAASIHCEPMRYAPLGLRVGKKTALQNLPLFRSGAIEVQDEGSQLLAHIVGAKRGEMIADFCAGAGGKTLALGAQMRNTGRLYAFDVSERRLANIHPRLARSGLSNVHPIRIANEKDARIKRLVGKIDRVLVDAPCSGLGTMRRSPDIQWRQSPESIVAFQEQQLAILSSSARLVKAGGRLVYATCSLLEEENEEVVAKFLSLFGDFELMPMKDVLAEQKIELEMQDYLKLLPHVHHTDGFFAAVMVRKPVEKQ
jgi:16S rRNA (cytosine967-C5)-methyltransferase